MDESDIEIELADEEYMELRRRIIAVVLCAVLVVLIILGATYALVRQRKEDMIIKNNAEEYNLRIRPLLEESATIKQELAGLNSSSSKTVENYGSVVLLCVEPGKWIVDDLKPICDLYGYKCTVAVSENAYPGKEGLLSVDELKALIDDGWELCISAQTVDQTEKIAEKLEQDGFERPENIYLPSGFYEESIDELSDYGYNNVITHGKENGKKVWRTYAIGCRETGVNNYLTNAVSSCECIVFSIGTLYTREAYTTELLSSLIGDIGSYVINGKTVVTSISEARERRLLFENIIGEKERVRIERESELNKRLSDIQNEIAKLNTSAK